MISFPVSLGFWGLQEKLLWEIRRVKVRPQPFNSSHTLLLICPFPPLPEWQWQGLQLLNLPLVPSLASPAPKLDMCLLCNGESSTCWRPTPPRAAASAVTQTSASPHGLQLVLWVPLLFSLTLTPFLPSLLLAYLKIQHQTQRKYIYTYCLTNAR